MSSTHQHTSSKQTEVHESPTLLANHPAIASNTQPSTVCSIPAGASNCSVKLSWTTTNPVTTSAVTSRTPKANKQVGFGNNGSTTAQVPYNNLIFFLYNNELLLATSFAISDCAAGTNMEQKHVLRANDATNVNSFQNRLKRSNAVGRISVLHTRSGHPSKHIRRQLRRYSRKNRINRGAGSKHRLGYEITFSR